jgi:hypothetical protein
VLCNGRRSCKESGVFRPLRVQKNAGDKAEEYHFGDLEVTLQRTVFTRQSGK